MLSPYGSSGPSEIVPDVAEIFTMPVVQHVPAFDEHLGPSTTYSPGLLLGVNGPPTGPVYPTLATQAATAVLATGEFEFDGQDVLWLAPVVDMKVSAALFVHVVSAGAASVTENLPAAQLLHA